MLALIIVQYVYNLNLCIFYCFNVLYDCMPDVHLCDLYDLNMFDQFCDIYLFIFILGFNEWISTVPVLVVWDY